ncbi:MAG: hypothetical protein RMK32_02010 [Anaerolineae bacterium]|nr:hypothetical protein [Thermoflexus sp.]MDW8064391.1 hypothetical protein [Anaerolineae bacterium]
MPREGAVRVDETPRMVRGELALNHTGLPKGIEQSPTDIQQDRVR